MMKILLKILVAPFALALRLYWCFYLIFAPSC